ncbi:DNA replication protein DnaD [Paraclostridium bifermentans]|uniref:DNA replication protein DnaD n=1 Tax=Paraclostridium bifermentans TaxID=1490 RepID=A0A5P3XAM7_PARBF|nr:DNA replication protein DnaD [Paraclostridium bifermentans]QEZ68017.1 DNA replication protein DnaD [Paraclostridium bifermentans]
MALYRQIFIEFWKDPKVTEEMSAEDRYTLLYLLTNPHTTQIGIYQITKRQIAFDLGYSTESVGAIIERFEKLLGLIRYNPETRELAIKNWGKYNLKRGGKPVLDCIRKELEKVKDRTLIEYVADSIPNETIKELFLRNVHVTSTISGQEEEQEQEKEQEEEEEQQQEKEEVKKVLTEVVDEISKYFLLEDEDVKKVANTYLATGKEINFLIEKLKLVSETPDVKNVVGYLLKAIQEDYKPIIGKTNNSIPSVKTRFHNINQSFKKYAPEQLEKILQESQKGKFN